jgi:putative endonuclease
MAGHKKLETLLESNGAPSLSRGQSRAKPHIFQDTPESNRAIYYVYILRCADDGFYVGSAQDVDARLQAHNEGRGAAYTFKHRPVRLVYSESFDSEHDALIRERQLKRWSRGKKEALINGDLGRLKHLSKRRS